MVTMIKNNSSSIHNKSEFKIRSLKCKVSLKFNESFELPDRNHTIAKGIVYNLLSSIDQKFSYELHSTPNINPYSFSLLKFHRRMPKGERKGHIKINRGELATIYINTIHPSVSKCLLQSGIQKKAIKCGTGTVNIEKIDVKIGEIKDVPDIYEKIRVKLHTPMFLKKYNALDKKYDRIPITVENIIGNMCDALYRIRGVCIDPNELYPYIRLLNHHSKLYDSIGYKRNPEDPFGKPYIYKGKVGTLVFKITANHKIIGKLFNFTEYMGIGSDTSSGFGHCSVRFLNNYR